MADTKAKVERALYGPSVTEVTLGALLSILVGGFLALVYLGWKPVETVKELPEEPEAAMVYYTPGSTNGTKGRQYLRKRQLLIEGGADEVISLSEDELNAWIASSRAKPDGSADSGLFVPQSINFRVRDGVFQIGIPCAVNLFGLDRPIIVQARGGFEKRDERFVFAPDELYVGSLAAHRVPGLTSLAMNRLLAVQTLPEELRTAWSQLERVEVEGDQLVLATP